MANNTNLPITEVQVMLRVLYPNSPLSVDGIYGQATKTEVEKYQKDYGLPITGVVDQATWDDMRKSYQRELVLLNKAEPLQIVLQPHQVLKSGSDNIHMYLIQALLTALHRFYVDMPRVAFTGILDPQTERAIVWFQNKVDVPESGELDKQTWQHLSNQYRLVVGDGTGSYPVRIAPGEPPGTRSNGTTDAAASEHTG